jgi:hypothetical protein
MAYVELFAAAARQVKCQDVALTLKRGKPMSEKVVDSICSKSPIPVPRALADFYLEIGNGVTFEWDAGGAYASLDLPEFGELIWDAEKHIKRWVEFSKDRDFPHTKNPALAKNTAARMKGWLRFENHGNGAGFCLDTSLEPAPVLFDQHAWFDGGAGENGHIMGASLMDFFSRWSKVCFQEPPGSWWPAVFQKSQGIDWESEKFAAAFRLTRAAECRRAREAAN